MQAQPLSFHFIKSNHFSTSGCIPAYRQFSDGFIFIIIIIQDRIAGNEVIFEKLFNVGSSAMVSVDAFEEVLPLLTTSLSFFLYFVKILVNLLVYFIVYSLVYFVFYLIHQSFQLGI
jgi:hypothetical protein